MPLRMTISPMTLYDQDDSIFDDFELPTTPANRYDPTAYSDLMRPVQQLFAFDRENFLAYLMTQTAELSTIYTNPDAFKLAIKFWSKTRIGIWNALYDTLFFRYNPIWNKDGTVSATESEVRNFANSLGITGTITHGKILTTDKGHPTETYTKTGGHTETQSDTRVQKETHGGTDTTSTAESGTDTESFNNYIETHQITQDDTTGQVSAFNDTGFANRDKSSHLLTETNTPTGTKQKQRQGTVSEGLAHGETIQREVLSGQLTNTVSYGAGEIEQKSYSGDDTETATESGSTGNSETRTGSDTGTGSKTESRREQGNIGVTSTQELISRERELVRFNLYEFILEDFKTNFLVLIY